MHSSCRRMPHLPSRDHAADVPYPDPSLCIEPAGWHAARVTPRWTWVLTVGAMIVAACAPRPLRQTAAPVPQAEAPPPQGAPPRRLDPSPEPTRERDREWQRRFLIMEGEAREQERARAATPEMRAEVVPGQRAEAACTGIAPAERGACVLESMGPVARLEEVAEGVRLTYRSPRMPAARLRHVLACQAAFARADPTAPPPCPFFDPTSTITVEEVAGAVVVDVVRPREVTVERLRAQLRAAFPGGTR